VGGFGFRSWTYNQVVENGGSQNFPATVQRFGYFFPVEIRGTVQIFNFFLLLLNFFKSSLYLIIEKRPKINDTVFK